MQTYAFTALISRMKYITRWGLMRCNRSESLSEHTADVAFFAHILCCISNSSFGGQTRPETVACAALYHDASEILTGDMPTPVKYKSPELKAAYKKTEQEAACRLAELLPPELKQQIAPYLTGEKLTAEEKQLLKAADRISAIVKCIEEAKSGNTEFLGAYKQQHSALQQMQLPEVDYFLTHMLPCYQLTLDELIS